MNMFSKETKDINVKLLKNLKKERQKGTQLISFNDPIERPHVYTGISKTALRTKDNKYAQMMEMGRYQYHTFHDRIGL